MTRKKINWAIVGLGAQAEKIACAILSSQNGILAASADVNIKRSGEFARKFNIKASFNSLKKLLKHPALDAIFISSPNYAHASQSIPALNAKKHVLCEKPMTLSFKEALAVKKAVKKNKRAFGVGFHLRFHPVFKEARDIIKSGNLGAVVFVDMHWSIGEAGEKGFPALPRHKLWRENVRESGGGSLMARGVHLFDLMNFLLGRNIENVKAFGDSNLASSVDQLTAGVARCGGAHASLVTSRKIPCALNRVVVYGSRGRLFMPDPFNSNGTGVLEATIMGKKTAKKFIRKIDLYKEEIEDFSDSILKNKTWAGAGVGDGLKSVIVTDKWAKSLKQT